MNNKKIKVCFVSIKAYPLFNNSFEDIVYGGAEVQMFQLAQRLSLDDDFEVFFMVGDFGQSDIENYGKIKVIKSMKMIRQFGFLSGIKEQFNFWLALKRINADVYIHRVRGIDAWVISLFCRFYKKKFIFMTANLPDVDKSFRKNNPLAGWIYEMGLKKADVVVTQNKEHQKMIRKNYKREAVVIKNSFNILREKENNSKKFILWVSNSRPQKNPEFFLKLVEDFPEENFIMIMPKNDVKLWNNISQKVNQYANLTFIEKVPFDKIDKYFKEAKIFVNTSSYEGFPNTFIQAAMFGTPLLSLTVNPDNFINKYHCGYVAEDDYGNMRRQLEELLHNQEIWEKFSENAFLYAKENHDIEKYILKLKTVINNLIKKT